MAAAEARDYVVPDDIKDLAIPVMAHRLIVTADAAMGGRDGATILSEVLQQVSVPVRGEA
jgi:MoxR-like ATPase